MRTPYSVCGHWAGEFDEAGLEAWAANLRTQLETPQVTLGLVYMTPHFFPHAAQVLESLRLHARVPMLVGCSSENLVCGGKEIEDKPGLVLGLYYLPGAKLTAKRFTQEQVDEADGPEYWHHATGVNPDQTNAGWSSSILSTPMRKLGSSSGTKPMRPRPFLAAWRAGFTRRNRHRSI